MPRVTSISHSVPASDSIGSYGFSNHFEGAPGDDQGSESFYENVAVVSDRRRAEPDVGERIFAPGTGRPVESQFSWRRGVAIIFMVIVAAALALSLKGYLSHQESRSNPEPESEPQAYSGSDQSIASTNPTSAPDVPSPAQVSEPRDFPASIPAAGMLERASALAPTVDESMLSQSPHRANTDDNHWSQSPQYAEPSSLNDPASVNPSSEVDSNLLPSATLAPENFEQTLLVSFAFDSDELLPDSQQALDRALKTLRDQPNSLASITGFTDSQGEEYYNLELSRKRADAVEQYLVEAGIERARLHVEGRGVLVAPVEDQLFSATIDMEPHRIVQIKISANLSQ